MDQQVVDAPRRRLSLALFRRPEPIVFVLAVAARLVPMIVSGHIRGNWGYDPTVYYSAADGLIHGQVPYRDFVLLHPPGMMLFDTPFAWLGSMSTDLTGFITANLAIVLLCGMNAVLVVRVGKAMGLTSQAATVGGVVYALWFGSVAAEYLARLEPLGNFFLLLGLLGLSRARTGVTWRRYPLWGMPVLTGAAFGAAVSVKMWWIVPIIVLMVWHATVEHRKAFVARSMVGFAAIVALVNGPFFAAAGSKMWGMVVLDQLGRPVNNWNLLKPFSFLSVGWLSLSMSGPTMKIIEVLGALIMFALLGLAWRRVPVARVIGLVLLTQLALIAIEPSWYTYYADFVTVPFALTVASAAQPSEKPVRRERTTRAVRSLRAPALAIALGVVLVTTIPSVVIAGLPRTRVSEAVESSRCIVADSQMVLIDLNVLSRSFNRDCPNWVDVTGYRFDLNRRLGYAPSHITAPVWNRDVSAYLLSGDALVMLARPAFLSLSPQSVAAINSGGIVEHIGPSLIRLRVRQYSAEAAGS